MRVAVTLAATVLLLSGCGGSGGTRNPAATTDDALPRLQNDAGAAVGREACKDLPPSTLPENGTKAQKIAALRAYLQQAHPNDDVQAMLRGCRSELNL
jgi:hypothetical protein